MAERVLIIGASGFIGGYLCESLSRPGCQVMGTYCKNPVEGLTPLNVLDTGAVKALLAEVVPDLVVFLAGTKDVQRCEREPGYAIDLNVEAVRNYVAACQALRQQPTTVFFSTDYVFDGVRGQYREGDAVGPRTVYGLTNLLAERLLVTSGLPGVLLRVSAVMGRRGGFFQWLDRSLSANQMVSLYDNTHFSPTSIGRLCRYIADYADSIVELASTTSMRVVHLSDGYRFSRYQFGCAVARCLGKSQALLQPSRADLSVSTFQADLSLMPNGLASFRAEADWGELENIF